MLEIVRASPQDVELLADFFREINTPEIRRNFSPHPFTPEEANRVCSYGGKDEYSIARLDGKVVVAYGMLRGWDEGYERPSLGICVRPGYQGRRLGRLMMEYLVGCARFRDAPAVILKVCRDNAPACALYERMGFVLSPLDEVYHRGVCTLS